MHPSTHGPNGHDEKDRSLRRPSRPARFGRIVNESTPKHDSQDVPRPIAIEPFLDTIQVWFSRKPKNEDIRKRRSSCQAPRPSPKRPRWSRVYRYVVHLHRADDAVLRLLDSICMTQGISYLINQVHVTLDLIVANQHEAELLFGFFDSHLVQRWHGRQALNHYKGTRYTSKKDWARNNIVMYCDRPSKINGQPCLHLEWRVHQASTVRGIGVENLRT